MQQIDELERLLALGLPEWSEELTELTDPVLEDLSRLMSEDPNVLGEVLDHLETGTEAVADLLQILLTPALALHDREPDGLVRCAGVTLPSRPALFLAQDTLTVPEKLRKPKKPWQRSAGWFFGAPQQSPATDTWPHGSDGEALDFIVQIDLARAAEFAGDLEGTGVPEDVTLQLFVDLDAQVGPADHRVLAFPAGSGDDRPMEPPRGSDVNDADPLLINPVGALTLPRAVDPEADADADGPEDRLRARLRAYGDRAPYDLNLWTRTDEELAVNPRFGYVPMARIGGYPIAEPELWAAAAREVLGCRPDEVFVLYDGPVDPEPQPVPDPDRLRIMVLVEEARLRAGDFGTTYAFGY